MRNQIEELSLFNKVQRTFKDTAVINSTLHMEENKQSKIEAMQGHHRKQQKQQGK